jgi:hypothetical protein
MAEVELNDSIEVGRDIKGYTSFASQIDLITEGPTGKPPRLVTVIEAGSGVLNLHTAHGARTNVPFIVGLPIPVGIVSIDTGTNIGKLQVIW